MRDVAFNMRLVQMLAGFGAVGVLLDRMPPWLMLWWLGAAVILAQMVRNREDCDEEETLRRYRQD